MDVRHLPLKNIITQSRKLPCPTPCPRLPVKRSIAHGTRFYMRGSHTISAPLPRRKLSSRSSWHYGSGLVSAPIRGTPRSEEHTSELQSLMRISYDVFCLKKKKR